LITITIYKLYIKNCHRAPKSVQRHLLAAFDLTWWCKQNSKHRLWIMDRWKHWWHHLA